MYKGLSVYFWTSLMTNLCKGLLKLALKYLDFLLVVDHDPSSIWDPAVQINVVCGSSPLIHTGKWWVHWDYLIEKWFHNDYRVCELVSLWLWICAWMTHNVDSLYMTFTAWLTVSFYCYQFLLSFFWLQMKAQTPTGCEVLQTPGILQISTTAVWWQGAFSASKCNKLWFVKEIIFLITFVGKSTSIH